MPKVISVQKVSGRHGRTRLLLTLECGHQVSLGPRTSGLPEHTKCLTCKLATPLPDVLARPVRRLPPMKPRARGSRGVEARSAARSDGVNLPRVQARRPSLPPRGSATRGEEEPPAWTKRLGIAVARWSLLKKDPVLLFDEERWLSLLGWLAGTRCRGYEDGPRLLRVLVLRYGIGRRRAMLQRDVARELGVSPTRIQHLESRATRRLARKLWPRE
jgi:hypothetical protein